MDLRLLVLTSVLLAVLAGPVLGAEPSADPRPLHVGRVTLEITDIYAPEEVAAARGLEKFVRRTMNGLHVDTREAVLRRELLFAEGDVYDPAALAETERNLRRLGILNGVVVTAVDTTDAGTVDVVVRTRDSWTLSTSLSFAVASDGKARWNADFAETNFLGSAITVGSGLGQDEDRTYWKLWYRKRRLFRTALWLGIDFSERGDGHRYGATLARPFYALDDPWGFHLQAWDHEADARIYLSHAGPAGVDPREDASLYGRVPRQQSGVLFSALRRLSPPGRGRIWRAGVGLRYVDTTYRPDSIEELSDDRFVDLRWLDDGDEPLARDEGREVHPHLALHTEGRSWTERRFVMQYGPVEDIPLHLEGSLALGPVGGSVGSTTGFGRSAWRGAAAISWWRPVAGGMLLLQMQGQGTTGDREVRRHTATALAGWVHARGAADAPWLTRIFAEGAHGSRLNGSEAFVLGLDRGLRTLDFDGMAGDRLVRWNLEQGKVTGREYFGLVRAGVAAFYSGGCAWWDEEDRDLSDARHEIGGGLRLGPTRSGNALTTRLDVSWSLDGSRGPVFTAVSRGHF